MTVQNDYRCRCGAPAEIGYPIEHGMRWFCRAHAPWQCSGCGSESGDEDNYAPADQSSPEQG
jgi:hypothetical protein